MQQGEVPERVAADREFGGAFVYDAQLLHRRVGAVLVHQLDQLQGLAGGRTRGVGRGDTVRAGEAPRGSKVCW